MQPSFVLYLTGHNVLLSNIWSQFLQCCLYHIAFTYRTNLTDSFLFIRDESLINRIMHLHLYGCVKFQQKYKNMFIKFETDEPAVVDVVAHGDDVLGYTTECGDYHNIIHDVRTCGSLVLSEVLYILHRWMTL